MTVRVYQFGLRPPTESEDIVRAQIRAAHDYRNDLVAIERGRRHALRAIDDASDEVRECVALVKAATKSSRKAALAKLRAARKAARAAASDELARIADREHELLLSARANTSCFWGSYLDIEAAHRQSRQQPLYGDDGVSPNDPSFCSGPRWQDALEPDDPRGAWWLAPGQVGIQIQATKPLTVAELLAGADTRVRLVLHGEGSRGRRYGTLWLRVGSEGRAPVWAQWPIKMHRALPDAAQIKWVRVSVRPEGPWERWTCEITVDDPSPSWRERVRPSSGAVAVEWEWTPLDDGAIRVARYADDRGASGAIVLPARIAEGIRKPGKLRALRDILRNEMHEQFVRAVRSDKSTLPRYVIEAANVMHLWRSPTRDVSLLMRWRRDGGPGGASEAYRILHEWYEGEPHECRGRRCPKRHGERHLYRYEAGARGEALRERREWYRVLAARWRREYRTVLLSDQDLSREARWGDDSDVRFVAGVSELRSALRNAFGADAIDASWSTLRPRDDDREDIAERSWCERCRDAWSAGGARGDGIFAAERRKTANAWKERKGKKKMNDVSQEGARNAPCNAAE